MLYPLEYKSNRVVLNQEGVAFELFEHVNKIYEIPRGEIVMVCAWTEQDRCWTNKLIKNGYQVSHGMTEKKASEQLKKLN